MGIKHIKLDEIESTQNWLKENISNYLDENILVSTQSQTKGIGRMGNNWSQMGRSLAFSFSLTPTDPITLTPLELGTLVIDYFNQQGIKLVLKWPNDILVQDGDELKKVGGILCHFHNKEKLIVGIGLNLDPEALPATTSFKFQPGAIDSNLQAREDFYHTLPYEILEFILSNRRKISSIKEKWNRSCAHLNKKVKIADDSNSHEGSFVGIGDAGEAILNINGDEKRLVSGSLWILE